MNAPVKQTIVVRQPAQSRTVISSGKQGPEGNAAPQAYEHKQLSPSDIWTVNHNLGFRPSVTVLSVGGREMWAEVIHLNTNQTTVHFDSPTPGTAVCS